MDKVSQTTQRFSDAKFKLFDYVIISGTATGHGHLRGIISDATPVEIGGKLYYTVSCGFYGKFFIAEHHLTLNE